MAAAALMDSYSRQKGNLSNTSPRLWNAVFQEKSEEHSQEWLCHDAFHEKKKECIWEWL
jgi:hypothetical protein